MCHVGHTARVCHVGALETTSRCEYGILPACVAPHELRARASFRVAAANRDAHVPMTQAGGEHRWRQVAVYTVHLVHYAIAFREMAELIGLLASAGICIRAHLPHPVSKLAEFISFATNESLTP